MILLDGGDLIERYSQSLHPHNLDWAELRSVPPLEDALAVDDEAHVRVDVRAQVRGRCSDVVKEGEDGLRDL